jgi:hypothetical protein
MYFLYKNEYRIFIPVEITIRKERKLERIFFLKMIFWLYYIYTWKGHKETKKLHVEFVCLVFL